MDGALELGLTQAGDGLTPRLTLDGFTGPLDLLLAMARAHEFDLPRPSLPTLVDQLVVALADEAPLERKADWVVMAAWLVQLRSRLLLPVETPAQQAAKAEAGRWRDRLIGLADAQALAAWLDARPQLGRDVFARGRPELLSTSLGAEPEIDVIAFLWAAMALFDDDLPGPDTADRYRPRWHDLHSVPEARLRILRLLAEAPDGQSLARLLPEQAADTASGAQTPLKRRSAWTSTFVASLELAKQGDVRLVQEEAFGLILALRAAADVAAPSKQATI